MKNFVRLFLLFSLMLVFDAAYGQTLDYDWGGTDYSLDDPFDFDYNEDIVFPPYEDPFEYDPEDYLFYTEGEGDYDYYFDPYNLSFSVPPYKDEYDEDDYEEEEEEEEDDYEEEEEEEEEEIGCCFICRTEPFGLTDSITVIDDFEEGKKASECQAGWSWKPNVGGYCNLTRHQFSQHCAQPEDADNEEEAENRSAKSNSKVSSISVYPTTNSGSFIVQLDQSKSSSIIIEVLDVEGKIIYKHKSIAIKGLYQHNVNVEHLALKGLYIVKTSIAKEVYVNRVIIAK